MFASHLSAMHTATSIPQTRPISRSLLFGPTPGRSSSTAALQHNLQGREFQFGFQSWRKMKVKTQMGSQRLHCNANSGSNGAPCLRLPCEQKVCEVPHLQDYLQDLRKHTNPLMNNRFVHPDDGFWLKETDVVAQNVAVDIADPSSRTQTFFHRAGPRYHIAFTPDNVRAAIVTCGRLCPGFNTVIQQIVNSLWFQYGVRDIRGIRSGYRGFFSDASIALSPECVDGWHKKAGTMLGTSEGGFDLEKIVDTIELEGLNHIYVIGGDGTLRGAAKVFKEVKSRALQVCVVGIPMTIDNDVGIIDRSFGFYSAVEATQAAIDAAHIEAESTPNGVGLVKLMGSHAGHIAVYATLSNRDVDCCLIPEVPFYMDGPGGLQEFVDQRLAEEGHCVIVVAEGAGQDLIERSAKENELERDVSDNFLPQDIGTWLGIKLKQWWKEEHQDEPFAIRYIDPTCMIRTVPCNATDASHCTLLAHSAVHGAMAGYTGFVSGFVNGYFCYVPLDLVATTQHLVDVKSHTLEWVKSVNNQPDFLSVDAREGALEEMIKVV